ncbi:unnamed protein product, partial [Scytosiphon promiscuus]
TSDTTSATTQQRSKQWTSSVFSTFFELELDPCPAVVADIYGTPEGGVVSYEEVQSVDCDEDNGQDDGGTWFAFEASCYAKSSFLDAASNWEDADARCGEMGARLVSLESEHENDFVIQNLLWIGFLGEAYTGLKKTSADGTWSWRDSLADFPPGNFDADSSFQYWEDGLDASSSYDESGASCLEILPYAPKAWNPFSCEVNKQYVCEKPAQPDDSSSNASQREIETPAPSSPLLSYDNALPTPFPIGETPRPPIATPSPSTSVGVEGGDGRSPTGPATPSSLSVLAVYDASVGVGDDEEEGGCVARLDEHDNTYLATYDMKVYNDTAACVEAIAATATAWTDTPDWCNSFDIGQECRSCWLSCAGARLFLTDFPWPSEEMILFCPGVSLSDFHDDCPNDGHDNNTDRRRTLRE